MSTSRACLTSGGFSGEFPTFRLLVVDDDPVWLRILERRLKECQYEVTTCNRAEIALSLLRKNKNNFHLVISDVHMPGMDGFKLLELIVLEMNLPVIMMSADDNRSVIMKGVIHGAHDYLVKTVMSIETLKNIWQHVVRQNKDEWKGKILDQSGNVEDGEGPQEHPEDVEYSFAANEGRLKNSNKRKEEENKTEERDDTGTLKKARVLWSPELHNKFVQAVAHLGKERAVPKKILELMNVPGLKRENVASHLQKYRLHQKKNQSGLENAFMGYSEAIIGTPSNNLDLHALAPTGQLPSQNLATHQAATWGRPATKSPIVIPSLVGQRNHCSFENSMLRYQGQQQMNNSNKQVNLPFGIPTTMEQFFGMNIPVARISQPQLRAQNMLSESNKVLSRNGIVDNARGSMYNQVPQASSSAVNFSLNQNIPLAGSSFPLSGNSTISATKEQFNSDYDHISQLYPQMTQDWGLLNVGSIFDASMEHSGQNINAPIAEAVLSSRQEIGRVNPIDGPQVNSVRAERYPGSSYQSTRIPEPFEQEDLMSTLLEQQQESSVGPVDNVFGLNDDAFEDLPM